VSADLHDTSPERVKALHAIRDRMKGESAATQCDRLLVALHELGGVTTFEAMRHLDIYDPRPRKLALVEQGHPIVMTWRTGITESGEKHRVGLYSIDRNASRVEKE
jgi:hypothetical protein